LESASLHAKVELDEPKGGSSKSDGDGDGGGGGALGGAPTSEMPEQLRNASRQAASPQAMQSGVVLSAAHSRRQLLTTQ
tara:strand:- start:176 stop:412 length:237 start_codon:yes stop_codon:yes gene_type:complete